MSVLQSNSRKSETNDKFTKEYKSPQESRFKMASFTEMVKAKSKPTKINSPNLNGLSTQTKTKYQQRYSYLSTTLKKPIIKAVKHQEINLENEEKVSQKVKSKTTNVANYIVANRKATSTQKERLKSTKLTTGISGRDTIEGKGFRSTDKIIGNRISSNQHVKKTQIKRPMTSTNKSHNFNGQAFRAEGSQEKNDFGTTLRNKRLSDATLLAQSKLKKQMSHEINQSQILASSQTPTTNKPKTRMVQPKFEYENKSLEDEDFTDNSYLTAERDKEKRKFNNLTHDNSDVSTPNINNNKGRASATPSRYVVRDKTQIFKIDSEAFEQPTADDQENLIVNLEDIVKEENTIFNIQEGLNKKITVDNLCIQWWELVEKSSVKEMQLFFEEESSKKLIRHQQILLLLTIGYIELMQTNIYKSSRNLSSIKNIMSNMHKNFLIFVDFICKNLTYQQRTKTKQWVDELYYILNNRPAAKTHYRCNNTQTLIRNNELSSNLLKNL
jgi:hypothetical protein